MRYLALSLSIMLIGGVAAAAIRPATVSTLPKQGEVVLAGTIDALKSDRVFLLRDATGVVDVKVTPEASAILKPGDRVTVVGAVDSGLFGSKDISASQIEIRRDVTFSSRAPSNLRASE